MKNHFCCFFSPCQNRYVSFVPWLSISSSKIFRQVASWLLGVSSLDYSDSQGPNFLSLRRAIMVLTVGT